MWNLAPQLFQVTLGHVLTLYEIIHSTHCRRVPSERWSITSAQMKSFQNDICYYKQGRLCEVILSIGWSKIGKKAVLNKIAACICLNSCRRFLDFFTEEKEFKIAPVLFEKSLYRFYYLSCLIVGLYSPYAAGLSFWVCPRPFARHWAGAFPTQLTRRLTGA